MTVSKSKFNFLSGIMNFFILWKNNSRATFLLFPIISSKVRIKGISILHSNKTINFIVEIIWQLLLSMNKDIYTHFDSDSDSNLNAKLQSMETFFKFKFKFKLFLFSHLFIALIKQLPVWEMKNAHWNVKSTQFPCSINSIQNFRINFSVSVLVDLSLPQS